VIQASKVGSDCGNFTKILLTDPSLSRKGVVSELKSLDRSSDHVHRRIKKVGAFPSGFRNRIKSILAWCRAKQACEKVLHSMRPESYTGAETQ